MCILPFTLYLAHGFGKKTTAALPATVLSLAAIGVVAKIFADATHISGLINEEIETLLYVQETSTSAAFWSQASTVDQLEQLTPKISFGDLFQRAMEVGRDHIATVINTLILVYTGSSLSTLLLFTEYPRPLEIILNNEIVVIRVAVALPGTTGLLLAVPLSTFFACLFTTRVS